MRTGRLKSNPASHGRPSLDLGGLSFLVASAVLLVLVLPDFAFPYLFDDYDFLARVLPFRVGTLLPDTGVVFYRPITRELYFGMLQALSPHSAMLGHAINAAVSLVAVGLVFQLGATTLGRRGGFLASLLFAGYAHLPFLVAWVSGAQDLLAGSFVLAAVLLEIRRRHTLAIAGFAMALLCKESALGFLPALVLAPWVVRAEPAPNWRRAADYLLVVVIWAAIHPGVRDLIRGGSQADLGLGGYVGSNAANLIGHTGLYIACLSNLPILDFDGAWPRGLTTHAVAAVLIGAAGAAAALRPTPGKESEAGRSSRRVAALSLLMILPPIVLTAALVRQWAPYYTVIAAPGAAVLAASALLRLHRALAIALVSGYLVIGVWTRGMPVGPAIPTEWSMAPVASGLLQVERELRALVPTLSPDTQVLVMSTEAEHSGLDLHLHQLFVLRQWYQLPNLIVVSPELREPSPGPELPLWVGRTRHVYRLDPGSLGIRAITGTVDPRELERFIRTYACGLAESGEVERGVRALVSLPSTSPESRAVNHRIAAALLAAADQRARAAELLSDIPFVSSAASLDAIAELLARPSGRPAYERPLLEAFRLSYGEPAIVRALMERLYTKRAPATARLADRLLELAPGDPRAMELLRKASLPSVTGSVVPRQGRPGH